MKRLTIITTLLLLCLSAFGRQAKNIEFEPFEAELIHDGSQLRVEIKMPLASIDCKSRQAVTLVPVVRNGTDSIELPMVAVYGHNRWIHYHRTIGENMLAGRDGVNFESKKAPAEYEYRAFADWHDWMYGASLKVVRRDYGCCSNLTAQGSTPELYMLEPPVEEPKYTIEYVQTAAEAVKSRSAKGRAFIDFPVGKTVILPDYRDNADELAKILATIDSIRNDRDITVTHLSIRGYASPEGSYAVNEKLARGRTEALKNYVQNLYHFAPGLIETSWCAEDWEGLRDWVVSHEIENREGILSVIDSDLAPDAKDEALRVRYPAQRAWLLANVYPALRHSDYRIDFEIRQFTDIAEIRRLVKEAPQKLSLNEFYLAAQSYEQGSDDFNEVFETAVRMYPGDETANLNAAMAALQRGDLVTARRYTVKAGDTDAAKRLREQIQQ